ncbi:homeobox protein 2-like isoform X2 [Chironomus tepperi]|uniref:homeobox protein 2-like isoform X2 n=1 Tax=Chironomus tepperi TaxID=113505 RepID=UPI00391F5849
MILHLPFGFFFSILVVFISFGSVEYTSSLLLNNDNLNSDSNSRSQSPNLRRQLPNDLSHEALEREAALVLEQVNSFGSLPHRKQAYKKPLRRSKSDASTKKLKRNSIFNFFNSIPASTNSISSTNSNQNNGSSTDTKTNDQKIVNNKKVGRSKSDISSQSLKHKREKYVNKLHINENNNNHNVISSDSDNNNTSLITNSLTRKKIPLSPITEVNTPLLDDRNCSDYFEANNSNINNVEGVEDCENSLKQQRSKFLSKSMESMHSSQMPVEKLPLTKHVRVDKIIKRLSVERLSPPPMAVLQAGGFSYTKPQLSPKSPTLMPSSPNNTNHNNYFNMKSMTPTVESHIDNSNTNSLNNSNHNPSNIVYTQVVCNDQKNADASKTIQNNDMLLKTSRKQSAASPSNLIKQSMRNDTVDFINTASDEKVSSRKHTVDEFGRDEIDNIASTNEEEPIIKANIRKHIPRYSSNTNIDNLINNHQQQQQQQQTYYLDNEFDRLNEMRETDFNNGIDATLSSRREILESRIKSRIGGLHINNDNNHTRSNPPTIHKRTYNKHGSNEFINNRFSPERKHLDFNKSSSPTRVKYEQSKTSTTYLDDGSMRKNSHHSQKFIDKYTDSGNETDIVVKNNSHNKNRYSSRFNIGRKWNYEDDIIECELFLMKERKHTDETYPYQLVRTYVYRQSSNNDDNYDTDQDKKNILKEWKHNKKMTREFIKTQTKKKSGLDKVKELFKLRSNKNNEENELRARYREYSPDIEPPPQKSVPTMPRRRLSTPTASPMTTSRSKSLPPPKLPQSKVVNKNASTVTSTSTLKRDKQSTNGSQQKFNWFASLDRLSRKKSRDLSNPPTIDRHSNSNSSTITRAKSSSMKNISLSNGSSKNLRFFGDTDLDDAGNKIKSPSHYDEAREKSTSLQNLNSGRRTRQSKSVSRSRAELINIAESTSDEAEKTGESPSNRSRPVSPTINNYLPPPRPPKSTKLVRSVSTLPRPLPRKSLGHDAVDTHDAYYPQYKRDSNLESDSNFSTSRRLRNSLSVSRENLGRDRFDSDASQRSVVYLHASVVGDIPQTYGRKLSGKSSVRTAYNEEQPIIRTVNSSLAMDAPWKPKFISDGYEINYSNDQKNIENRRKFRSKSATREKSKWDREAHKRT